MTSQSDIIGALATRDYDRAVSLISAVEDPTFGGSYGVYFKALENDRMGVVNMDLTSPFAFHVVRAVLTSPFATPESIQEAGIFDHATLENYPDVIKILTERADFEYDWRSVALMAVEGGISSEVYGYLSDRDPDSLDDFLDEIIQTVIYDDDPSLIDKFVTRLGSLSPYGQRAAAMSSAYTDNINVLERILDLMDEDNKAGVAWFGAIGSSFETMELLLKHDPGPAVPPDDNIIGMYMFHVKTNNLLQVAVSTGNAEAVAAILEDGRIDPLCVAKNVVANQNGNMMIALCNDARVSDEIDRVPGEFPKIIKAANKNRRSYIRATNHFMKSGLMRKKRENGHSKLLPEQIVEEIMFNAAGDEVVAKQREKGMRKRFVKALFRGK